MTDVNMDTETLDIPPPQRDEKEKDPQGAPETPKLPPCDQCRRRKVKCDGKKVPCERLRTLVISQIQCADM